MRSVLESCCRCRSLCPAYAQMFDVDGSGEIDEDEFGLLLEYMGIEVSEQEMERLFKRFDTVNGLCAAPAMTLMMAMMIMRFEMFALGHMPLVRWLSVCFSRGVSRLCPEL